MANFFIGWLVPYSIAIPIFFALLQYKDLTRPSKTIFFYLVVSVIFTIASYILRHTIHNNLPLLHLYTVVEFLIFAEFYKQAIDTPKSTRILLLIQILFTLACIANAVFWQNIFMYNSYSLSFGALLIMLFAINYFSILFTKESTEKTTSLPLFWFNTGIFLYFSGGFFLYIFSNFVVAGNHAINVILWNLHGVFVLLMYILFTIGFIKCKK